MGALPRRELEMFMNQARVKLPGASDTGIGAELYDTMKEFFNDTNAWREDIPFTPQAGTPPINGDPFISSNQDYTLAPQDGTGGQIIKLIAVYDDVGIPIPSIMRQFGVVHLINPVSTVPLNPWIARVVKTVTVPLDSEDQPIAPDWTLRVYSVQLLDGLLGRMMTQTNKSFSNSEQGVYHLRRFRSALVTVRTAVSRENLVGAQDWQYPRGWSMNTQRGGVSTAWPTRAF